MSIHKALSMAERVEFRKWARVNYLPFSPIDGTWHPVVQHECVAINEEAHLQLAADQFEAQEAS
ncbi:MAG TPA: hypothetical protein VFH87_01725 [Candidatus Udaeobacter sp.]|nr:hypothetical protein [Candidatus Udaeobacter sp.]